LGDQPVGKKPDSLPARNRLAAQSMLSVSERFRLTSLPPVNCLFSRRMSPTPIHEVFIQGVTLDGQTFRPSDWAERLAGAMSCFRPEGSVGGIASFIGYSPYCVPRVIDGVKCVIVDQRLREVEPMAWDFVMHFARDNRLQVAEACWLPPTPDK
jgi:Protein of unknown function (DUF3579)